MTYPYRPFYIFANPEAAQVSDGECVIYALAEEDTGKVRYIGATKSLKHRVSGHFTKLTGSYPTCAKEHWLRDMVRTRRRVVVIALERVHQSNARSAEGDWMRIFTTLTNVRDMPYPVMPSTPKRRWLEQHGSLDGYTYHRPYTIFHDQASRRNGADGKDAGTTFPPASEDGRAAQGHVGAVLPLIPTGEAR